MQTTEPLPATALPLYTIDDAATALGVSEGFLRERIRDNQIATVDLGSAQRPKLRIRSDTLQDYIQARTTREARPVGANV